MVNFGTLLDSESAQALLLAEATLSDRGYRRISTFEWQGNVALVDQAIDVVVRLSASFPRKFPEVLVRPDALKRRVAHVERENAFGRGKLCLIPASGVFFDTTDPAGMLDAAVSRAVAALEGGLAGATDCDLSREFLAYWPTDGRHNVSSILDTFSPSGLVYAARVTGIGSPTSSQDLVASNEAGLRTWARTSGYRITDEVPSFFLRLASAFAPPNFGERFTLNDFLQLVRGKIDSCDLAAFGAWLDTTTLPAMVLFSIPYLEQGDQRVLAALRMGSLPKEIQKKVEAGFRPGAAPPTRRSAFARGLSPARLVPDRMDAAYLTERGGANQSFGARTVSVVGVGAIGSAVAQLLGAIGVGRVHLIDPEKFAPENVHRHALGVNDLGKFKALAMAVRMAERFPHASFTGHCCTFEELIRSEAEVLTESDMIVVALGDETVERTMNRLLINGPPRAHCWVEALGLAGHVLLRSEAQEAGCFECILKPDLQFRFVNQSALAAPGQEVKRTLAGCAGNFSPFSAINSSETALEAVKCVTAVLSGTQRGNCLVTWRGETDDFERAGHSLSPRASKFAPGAREVVLGAEFARDDCPMCGFLAAGSRTKLE